MKTIQIIADSGGTSTNWCIVTGSERVYFSTESYHPIHWNEDFEARILKFWQEKVVLKHANLHFFGAGCLNRAVQEMAIAMFERVGFKKIQVLSDLHGAAIATLGDRPGWVLIAGTGSVLFEWNGLEVLSVIGGKGHKIGDEGSGYYFGKLVLEAFRANVLNPTQVELFLEAMNPNELNESNSKYELAALAKKIVAAKKIFLPFHLSNVQALFSTHQTPNPIEIVVVGGYGWHHQEVFSTVSKNYPITIKEFLNEPIAALVEQMVHLSE